MTSYHAEHQAAVNGVEEVSCHFCGNRQLVAKAELHDACCKVCLAAMIPQDGPVQDPAWMAYAPVSKAPERGEVRTERKTAVGGR